MKIEEREEEKIKLPLNPIRRIMEQYSPFTISDDAVRALRDILTEVAYELAFSSAKKHLELNKFRAQQGLKPQWRLSKWSVENSLFTNNFLYLRKNKNWDCAQIEDTIPGSESMSKDEIIAKPDKSTDDQEEVE